MSTKIPQNENEFQSMFNRFYIELWYWVYKIRDVGWDTKPFDCELKTRKRSYSIELKYERRKTMIDVESLMKPHQIGNLRKIESLLPWTAFVVTYHRETKLIYVHSINDLIRPIYIWENLPIEKPLE